MKIREVKIAEDGLSMNIYFKEIEPEILDQNAGEQYFHYFLSIDFLNTQLKKGIRMC